MAVKFRTARFFLLYSWLDQLLLRIIWMMKLFIDNVNSDHEAATQRLTHVIGRLRKLRAEQEWSKEELRERVNGETDRAIEALITYLKSPQVIESFCRWNSGDLPDVEGSWEVTESAIMKLIQNRLQTLIEEWEGERQNFAEARKSVVTFFLRKYSYLENELRDVEIHVSKIGATPGTTTRSESIEEQPRENISNFSMPLKSKIALGIMMPILIPATLVGVALAVPVTLLVLPVVGIKSIADQIQEAKKKSKYNKDRSEFVQKISQKYLEKVATEEALRSLVEDQIMQALSCVTELEAKIPMLIEADMELCPQLIDQSQDKKGTEANYRPRKEKCERLREELTLFGSFEIRGMAIAWDDLEWEVSEKVDLNHSLPPGIYQGRIAKGRYASSGEVTLKVYKELLTSSNATTCLEAEETMRYCPTLFMLLN